nr:MAG TPA: hypothetical protein [Bacteriophage sp.]
MYEINKTYETPKGLIKILSRTKKQKLPNGKFKHPRAVIQFVKTGTVIDVQTCNIKAGKFEDFMEPTVYGVGFLGSPIRIPARGSNSIIRKIYDLWANMLKRAYGNYGSHSSYIDCVVDPRWHNFTTFLNTIHEVEGYEEWEKDSSMHLDKDIKKGYCKIYSRDHCKFVSAAENVAESVKRRWGKTNDLTLT